MRQLRNIRIAALTALLIGTAACGSIPSATSESAESTTSMSISAPPTDANQLDVNVSAEGCSPAELTTHAGFTIVHVHNMTDKNVTEIEILDDKRLVGEVENIAAASTTQFWELLKPGSYIMYCPGDTKTDHGILNVRPTTPNHHSDYHHPLTSALSSGASSRARRPLAALPTRTLSRRRSQISEMRQPAPASQLACCWPPLGNVDAARTAVIVARHPAPLPISRLRRVASTRGTRVKMTANVWIPLKRPPNRGAGLSYRRIGPHRF